MIGLAYGAAILVGTPIFVVVGLFVLGVVHGEVMEKRVGSAKAKRQGVMISIAVFIFLLFLFLQTIIAGGIVLLWIALMMPLLFLGGTLIGSSEKSIVKRFQNKS